MTNREKIDEAKQFLACSRLPAAHHAAVLLDQVQHGKESGARAALRALLDQRLMPLASADREIAAAVLLLQEVAGVPVGVPPHELPALDAGGQP